MSDQTTTAIPARARRIFTVDVEMTQKEAYRFFEVLADLAIDWEPEGVDASVSMGLPPDACGCDSGRSAPS